MSNERQLLWDAVAENELLRAALIDIRDCPEPKANPEPDDADWRFIALEMKRVAAVAVGEKPAPHKTATEHQR